MKKIQVLTDKWQTSDGKNFNINDIYEAQIHQDIIDGKKKICDNCEGSKEEPDAEYRNYYKCQKCNGKGFLELKWI